MPILKKIKVNFFILNGASLTCLPILKPTDKS